MVRAFYPLREGSLRPFGDFYRELDDLAHHLFENNEEGAVNKFTPHANLSETETGYELTLDLPGVNPEDVTVELNDGELSITGDRKSESEESGKTFHRIERQYGKFRRVVSIPVPVDEEKITADYAGGVLTVTVPKSEKIKPKRIPVKRA